MFVIPAHGKHEVTRQARVTDKKWPLMQVETIPNNIGEELETDDDDILDEIEEVWCKGGRVAGIGDGRRYEVNKGSKNPTRAVPLLHPVHEYR